MRLQGTGQEWVEERLAEIEAAIEDPEKKIEALLNLASELLPSRSEVLQQTLDAANSITDDYEKAKVLSEIAPQLPESEQKAALALALNAADNITDAYKKADSLSAIALQMDESQQRDCLKQAIAEAEGIQNETHKVEVLDLIALRLPKSDPDLFQQVLDIIDSLEGSVDKAKLLSLLSSRLPESQRHQLLQEALDIIRTNGKSYRKAEVLRVIALYLPESAEDLLQQALNIAQSIQEASYRANALCALFPCVPKTATDILKQGLNAAQTINDLSDLEYKVKILSAISPRLPESRQRQVLQQALNIAQSIQGKFHDEGAALSAIAPHLPESQQYPILQQALATTCPFRKSDNLFIASTLREIVYRLPQGATNLLQQALDAVQTLETNDKATVLNIIASRLPESAIDLLQKAFNTAQTLETVGNKALVLSTISSRVPEFAVDLLQQILNKAYSLEVSSAKVKVLGAIAHRLPESSSRHEILQQAYTLTQSIEGSRKTKSLSMIAPHLTASQQYEIHEIYEEELNTIQAIESSFLKVSALRKTLPWLPKSDVNLLQQVLNVAQSISTEDSYSQANALEVITPYLPESATNLIQQVLDIAQSIKEPSDQANSLRLIASRFPKFNQQEILQQALKAAQSIEDSRLVIKLGLLSAIALYLPKSQQHEVLQGVIDTAQSIEDVDGKANAFRKIASHLPKSDPEFSQEVLQIARSFEDVDLKLQVLIALLPRFPKALQPQVLQQVLDLIYSVDEAETKTYCLYEIADCLTESVPELIQQTFNIVQSIETPKYKLEALKAVASNIPISTFLKQYLETTLDLSVEGAAAALAPYAARFPEQFILLLPVQKHSVGLKIIKFLSNETDKTKFINALIPVLSVSRFPTVLNLIELEFKNDQYRAEALNTLAPYLLIDQFSQAFALILKVLKNPYYQTSSLVCLIPLSKGYLFKDTNRFYDLIAFIRKLPSAQLIAAILQVLTTSLVTAWTDTSLIFVKKGELNIYNLIKELNQFGQSDFSYEKTASDILCQLAPVLAPDEKNVRKVLKKVKLSDTELEDVFDCVRQFKDLGYKSKVLIAFAPYFPEFVQKCLSGYAGDDYATLLQLKTQLALPGNPNFSSEYHILNLKKQINNLEQGAYPRAESLIEIARHPAGLDIQTEALRAIRGLTNAYLQSQYLQRLIPKLQPRQRIEAANIIGDINDPDYSTQALVALACAYPEFRAEAKEKAEQLNNTIRKVEQLSLLAVEVPEILPEIITIAEDVKQPTERFHILVALTPHLPLRIDNELKRGGAIDCADDLWNRALYLLARSYRDALKGGSLRSESTQADDLLNLKDEVDALADMLLMRDLEPPMTVGILGGWGGGKSYIMHLMQTAITHVRSRKVEAVETWNPDPNSEKLSPYVGHIYQIKFDAWTFAKSNLWASLMQTIFFELNRQISLEQQLSYVLATDPDNEDDRRQALCESGHYWAVLYKTDEADRQNFLEHVLPGRLEQLREIQNQGKFEDELWQQFGDTYRDESQKLADLQQALAAKTKELIERKQTITESVEDTLINQVLQSPAIAPAAAILSSRVSEKAFEHLTTEIRGAIAEQIKRDEHAQQAIATTDTEQLKAIVKAITIRVIESRSGKLDFASFLTWFKRSLRLFGLLIFFLLLALLLPIAVEQILGWVLPSVDALVARAISFLAPLTPGIATAQSLLQGARKWFDETNLAVKEYETQLQAIPEQLEARKKTQIQATIEQDPQALELEAAIQTLQQQIAEQAQRIPQNVYASLEEFVSDRLQSDNYNRHLGIMHQVKDDLADLSRRLLPPPATSQEFQAKLGQLQKIFPRGPARVVVYIDDLDRCPPKRVVEVLEAVQLLVKTPLFIAVLAIDERYITRALEKYYDGVLSRRGRPSGTDYLEKIIQLPYRVRPITPSALETYLKAQVVLQDSGTSGSKFSEFSRQEFDMLLRCCRQTHLSPRTLKRLTNVYKLFKVVCRTRGTKPSPQVQQAILGLLALSGRYPDLMRSIFDIIEVCYEEARTRAEVDALMEDPQKRAWAEKQGRLLHLDSPLIAFFRQYSLPASDRYLQREFDKLQHDALETGILPPSLTLKAMTHEIFNLIRSFSFVGEIGEDPEDYRFSGPIVADSSIDN
ncbi:MAG: P-loop NTPase fold protein [Cyanobacteria bacterium P01_H01_bin.58]